MARSYYDSDFVVGDTVYPIKGNAQPGYPQISLVSDLSAHFGDWRFGATSTSYLRQPFTYENDIRVPTFWQVNTYAAYRFGTDSAVPGLELRLDVSNLFNRHNIGTATIAGSSFSGITRPCSARATAADVQYLDDVLRWRGWGQSPLLRKGI